jgi:hypothetical protein
MHRKETNAREWRSESANPHRDPRTLKPALGKDKPESGICRAERPIRWTETTLVSALDPRAYIYIRVRVYTQILEVHMQKCQVAEQTWKL